MAGYLGGSVKGKSSSTDARIEVPGYSDLELTKSVGADYWYYARALDAGDYDVTARDVTTGAGGNHQTKSVTITEQQFSSLDFDIS